MNTPGHPRAVGKLLLFGIVSGILILTLAQALSQALSQWAFGHRLAVPLDGSLSTRFVAWATISLVAGLLMGLGLGRTAVRAALLATATLVAVHSGSMFCLFGGEASHMITPFLFEFSVVAFVLSIAAYLSGRWREA